jgi:hypothetical protein
MGMMEYGRRRRPTNFRLVGSEVPFCEAFFNQKTLKDKL